METDINSTNPSQQLPQTNQVASQSVPEPQNNKLVKTILYVVGAVVFMAIGAFGHWFYSKSTEAGKLNTTPTSNPIPSQAPTTEASPSSIPTSNQQLLIHDSKFIQFSYPKSLYVWSFGRGVNLEYFQINSVTSDDQTSSNRTSIDFDIHIPQYKPEQTLEEMRQNITKSQKDYPLMNYVMSDRKIDGLDALVIESTGNTVPSSAIFYSKKVWVRKNNVVYEIDLNVVGESVDKRDALKAQYNPVFENILSSVKLKYVDPAEVEQLGNHPD